MWGGVLSSFSKRKKQFFTPPLIPAILEDRAERAHRQQCDLCNKRNQNISRKSKYCEVKIPASLPSQQPTISLITNLSTPLWWISSLAGRTTSKYHQQYHQQLTSALLSDVYPR